MADRNQDPSSRNTGERNIVSPLRLAGYAVLPAPRQVERREGGVKLDASWGMALSGVDPADIAVRSFQAELALDHGFALSAAGPSGRRLELLIRPDAADTGPDPGRHAQGYRLEISPEKITIAGNAAPGLFYGVQTLLQLMDGDGARRGILPVVQIADWPEYELRCIHWDTKHHQDRPETLRRYLDQAARFKINAVLFELEDKFEYPSHPVIGAPGAFTTAELQGLVNYGLERHIRIIPDIQGPAHMAYVLKHEEFAHLRCDGSNYQICMDDPEARRLLFDMYDDVCKATQGVEFFHVSTDEVYYAGICEKYRRPYNPENRSLTWVDFVTAAHAHLAGKGRRVIVWGEHPLLPQHIKLLPRDLLNGVASRTEAQARDESERGIRPFVYTALQGTELLFPNYFAHIDRDGRVQHGRLENALHQMLRRGMPAADYIGAISAAWDDSGLHNETFWLGWSMAAQGSWTPGVSVEETVAAFMDVFYGREVEDMTDVYHELQTGARFYEHALERIPSRTRGPAYGEWDGKRPIPRTDRTMLPPALPNPTDLSIQPAFRPRYARAIAEAPEQLTANDKLLMHLHVNLSRVRRNRHNLEVYLSLAGYLRHFINTILSVAAAEDSLVEAAGVAAEGKKVKAARLLMDAHARAQAVHDDLYATYDNLKAVWEKSRHPKGRSVGDRNFVHVMDDVKDHLADRRPDLSYLISPEENIGMANWLADLRKIAEAYMAAQGLTMAAVMERHSEE